MPFLLLKAEEDDGEALAVEALADEGRVWCLREVEVEEEEDEEDVTNSLVNSLVSIFNMYGMIDSI